VKDEHEASYSSIRVIKFCNRSRFKEWKDTFSKLKHSY